MTSTHLAIGCGGNYVVSLEVLHELEDMIDARLKELDDQNS